MASLSPSRARTVSICVLTADSSASRPPAEAASSLIRAATSPGAFIQRSGSNGVLKPSRVSAACTTAAAGACPASAPPSKPAKLFRPSVAPITASEMWMPEAS